MAIIKKLTPLIVLGLFAISVYLMMQGMDNAVKMTKTKQIKNEQNVTR